MTSNRQLKTAQIFTGTCAAVIVLLVFIANSPVQQRSPAIVPVDILPRVQECRQEIRNGIGVDSSKPEIWNEIANICYMQVRGEALLTDFNIRRSTLLEQQVEGRVILWMVVAITVSGVVLAGLQLLAAYRLATTGHEGFAQAQEITLEQKRISLKSSVTGLMILVISFAFFMVYVVWVYTVKELKQEAPETANTSTSTRFSPRGGYGPPPTTSAPTSGSFGEPASKALPRSGMPSKAPVGIPAPGG